jgi:hypothetical protein
MDIGRTTKEVVTKLPWDLVSYEGSGERGREDSSREIEATIYPEPSFITDLCHIINFISFLNTSVSISLY